MSALGLNVAGQAACARESSQTILDRRLKENCGRAELYQWLLDSIEERPLTSVAEEALWSLLIRERPY